MSDTEHYQKSYGMNMGKHGPDFERCCVEVGRDMGRWTQFGQCSKKRGFGPDKAFCKIHDPDVVKARREKAEAAYNVKRNQERYSWYGRHFFDALKEIADGHNDARGHAQAVIDEFMKGQK